MQAELDWLCHAPDLMLPPSQYRCPPELRCPVTIDSRVMAPVEPGRRLGNHFENIVFQYLNYNTQVTDIKRNIQIRTAQKTLGELDFLVRLADRWLHLEVALKLYLLDGSGRALDDFIGTRRDDRLGTKWQRMLDHQLRLTEHPVAHEVLSRLGIDAVAHRALWVKGWLFYPFGTQVSGTPVEMNPHHLRGWWLTQSQLGRLAGYADDFLVPDKVDWVLPPTLMHARAFDLNGLIEQLTGSARCRLVVAVMATPQGVVEISRGFVVPDDWAEAGC
jgi:hypothetical protein